MGRDHHFDIPRNALFVRAWGEFTDEEFLRGFERVIMDPAFRSDARALIDLRKVTEMQISAHTLETFATSGHFAAGARHAYVVGSHFQSSFVQTGAGLSTGPEEIRVFTDRTTAIQWLNEGVGPDLAIT